MKRNYKNRKKTIAILLCMVLMGLLLGGCGAAGSGQPAEQDNLETLEEDGVYITLYLTSDAEETESDTSGVSDELETVDDLTTTMVTIVPEDSLNAETIVNEYNQMIISSLYGETVVINEVKTAGNQVWVDFDSKSLKALPLEEGTEGILFYHMARSITDNLGDVDDVFLTMDGGQDFRLAHLWFEASRPFYSGAMPVEGE